MKKLLQPFLAVAAGLTVGLAVTWAAGENPFHVLRVLLTSARRDNCSLARLRLRRSARFCLDCRDRLRLRWRPLPRRSAGRPGEPFQAGFAPGAAATKSSTPSCLILWLPGWQVMSPSIC